ncbi:hypothetical protein JW758_06135 [Candidatus Peregrinibacteria bacterium]|nr:hypothetical protein [Candidatus Peregrinibacteria bacterium]
MNTLIITSVLIFGILLFIYKTIRSSNNEKTKILERHEQYLQAIEDKITDLNEEIYLSKEQLTYIRYIAETATGIKAEDVEPGLLQKKQYANEQAEKIAEREEKLENLRRKLKRCGLKFTNVSQRQKDPSITDEERDLLAKESERLIKESGELQEEIKKIKI